jgi:hypothetical protein
MPTGRPSDWNQEIAQFICERISLGESLVRVCQDPDMPERSTVYRWMIHHEGFSDMYARAKEAAMEMMAEEIIEIADDSPQCIVPDPDGGVSARTDAAGIQRNRLRVDTRKWLMSKLAPKKYGDKIQTTLTGANDGPIQAAITVNFVKTGE